MRVLHISSERSWRGGEQQIAYLIEELQKAGVANYVACRKGSAFENYCREQNLPHVSLPFANQFDIFTSFRINQYCRQNKIDLVHVHSSHSHALSIWADFMGGFPPVVLSRRVDFPVSSNALSKFKYQYKGIKKVICVSDKVREIVLPALRNPHVAVTVYDGIDTSRFAGKTNTGILHRELNLDKSIKLIGNVSAIAPHKDYFTFVNTAEIVLKQKENVRFLIIGDGPLRDEIEAYLNHKNLQNQILFTGFRNDVPAIFPELDVLLMTSETEGLGTTILDAFACGVPVVATKGGGIPEIVHHKKTGLLAEVKDADTLAKYVIQVLENETLSQNLSRGAHDLLQNFTKYNTAHDTLTVYKEVLNNL